MSNQSVNTSTQTSDKAERFLKIDLEKNNTSNSKMKQPNYPNCLKISDMKELGLFDTLLYGEVKDFVDREYDDIEVEITDLKCDKEGYKKTKFKFDLRKECEVILEYDEDGSGIDAILEDLIEDQDQADERDYEDHADDMKEVIGEFNCCDIKIFESDYPTREFKELQEELEADGYLECFIHEPKKEATTSLCMSEISVSIGNNKRVIRTIYNTSSPFALWLCNQEFHYYLDSESEDSE